MASFPKAVCAEKDSKVVGSARQDEGQDVEAKSTACVARLRCCGMHSDEGTEASVKTSGFLHRITHRVRDCHRCRVASGRCPWTVLKVMGSSDGSRQLLAPAAILQIKRDCLRRDFTSP
jgi:hypothetical protein